MGQLRKLETRSGTKILEKMALKNGYGKEVEQSKNRNTEAKEIYQGK